MSIRSKTSDQARSIPYLDGAAIEKLLCLFNGRLIIRALDDLGRLLNVVVLTEEEDSIGPHHARPAPVFEFEGCTGRNFYASGIARRRAKKCRSEPKDTLRLLRGMSPVPCHLRYGHQASNVECPTDARASDM